MSRSEGRDKKRALFGGNERRVLVLAVLVALLCACAVPVFALGADPQGDESKSVSESLAPTAAQTREFLESGKAEPLLDEPETDLHAAQTMPHRDLGRGEALELAEAVFDPELERAGGIFGELEPERFVSNYAAVVPVSSLPEEPGQSEEGLAAEHPDTPVLLESTLPLRTEDASGEEEAVDLGLEHSEGELQPENPLAEVGVPEQLGEGISLDGPEVEVTIAGAPEDKVPTDSGGEFAFYPEVAEDTDLIVTPTPQGVETMTDIRSPEALMRTTYELSLPAGAELRATGEGGAEVVEGGRATLMIPAPTAVDAAGDPVQTELGVSDGSIVVTTTPNPSTAYPILVDPTYITEGWRWTLNHESMAAWSPNSTNTSAFMWASAELWASQYPGLDLSSGFGGNAAVGTQANWEYWVPRYREDLADFGSSPSSWVYQMSTEGVQFHEYGNNANYPALVIGLVNPENGWQSTGVHYGGQGELTNWNEWFPFENKNGQTTTKGADMNLVTYEAEYPSKRRDTYMADAYIAVVDEDAPVIKQLNPPSHWLNTTPETIPFKFEDKGLGVRSAGISFDGSALPGWGFDLLCSATTASPCPRRARSSTPELKGEAQTALAYYPGSLPTGIDTLTVTAGDVMWGLGIGGHTASGEVVVKVDHTAPEVTLSGSLTEQGTLGTHRPTYALKVNAKDGTEAAPQSGVKKVEVLVDGKKVAMPEEAEWEPDCLTENCHLNDEWLMNASEYGTGPHEVKVVATDAVGNTTTRTLQVELHPTPPTLTLSGALTEQTKLGTELPSYKLTIADSASAESPPAAALPTYSSSFGTSGTGNGQFARPGSVAVDAQGNLWVVDSNNNRLEKFSEKGEYLSKFGTEGSGNGQLKRPTALAIDAAGNLWVTDSRNKRVEEFGPTGSYLGQFGTAGTGNGQFAGSGPEGIAIDDHGNIWVADTYGGRLEKFNEHGEFIRSVGGGQLGRPTSIAIGPGGDIFVTDWENNKVAEYGEGGALIRQFGSSGKEAGQLEQPTAIAVDSRGDVWVGDEKNERIEEFNQGGEYLGRFGSAGSGAGQFGLSYPGGIATDTKGDIWVADTNDNRVEKWVSANYLAPSGATFLRSFGTEGTGNGQFRWPIGVAADGKGNVWVGDFFDDRVEKFNENGGYLSQFGTAGTGSGQFDYPYGVAVDPKGHLWVADSENDRVQEFGETGTFIRQFGTLGAGAGQLHGPLGIAVDPKDDVWVTDALNYRVEEFSETGTYIRSFGSKGSGPGQFAELRGLAVAPGGDVWVADPGNNRIEEFTETGGFVRQVGGEGVGSASFRTPNDIDIDAAGNLWVTSFANNRVVELGPMGESIAQFGSAGTGAGQFQNPTSIALDGRGHAFVTDYTAEKVDEWTLPASHSQISTEITVDGRRVEASETGCASETCPATKEWTLQSSSLTPGPHVVVVRATDGLGNTTSKTLNVKVGDTTKPGLEVGGELATAPEGWIEQEEGDYALHATASDAGYGVTSLVFSLDGKTVASKTQGCPAGGCSATISTSVNAHTLAAGAHEAEVVATDGAGNVATRRWMVNVDPEGRISTEEAEATIEAAEETSEVPILGATEEIPGIEASTSGLGLTEKEEGEGALRATGSYIPMEVGAEPDEGFVLYVDGLSDLALSCDEVEDPEEEACVPRATLEAEEKEEEEEIALGLKHPGTIPITVKPVATGAGAGSVELVEGQSALSADAAGEEADTVTRPASDGGLNFADIRSSAAPEHYAFELELSPELELRQADPQHVEVVYKKYPITAFDITAEPAHDAIGTEVPTHLSISGPSEVTLTVEHRAPSPAGGSFVYPVLDGTGWQGGYQTFSYEMNEPLPPAEGEEEEEELEEEGVSVDTSSEYIRVDIVGFGPQHVSYSGSGGDPTPHEGWAQYIGRECDWLSGEYGTESPGKGSGDPVGGKGAAGPAQGILDELIYHCHKHLNDQGGTTKPRFAVEVNGTYSWVYGEEARIRTKPHCRVAGLFPPAEEGCGGPTGEVSAGGGNPKVYAYNRVWFSRGSYKATVPWCAKLEVVLPSKPKLQGKHALENWEYIHWHLHEQGLNETAANCPWEHF